MGNYKNSFFDDSELATPLHDKMVLWTFDNAEKIIKDLGFVESVEFSAKIKFSYKNNFWVNDSVANNEYFSKWEDKKEIKEYLDNLRKKHYEQGDIISALIDFSERYKNAKLNCEKKKIMEYPLLGYNGFNLGFIDLLFRIDCEYCDSDLFHYEIFIENCESAEYGNASYQSYSFAFEIKPFIKSIGETLRQFQFYRGHLNSNTKLILVTKTKGLKEIFEGQGFYVVEYEDNQEFDF